MKKVMICLLGCFLMALTAVRAQDTGKNGSDSVITLGPDTTTQTPVHSTISRDTTSGTKPDTAFRYHGDNSTDTSSTAATTATPATAATPRTSSKRHKKHAAATDSTSAATASTPAATNPTPVATGTPAADSTATSSATPRNTTDTLIALHDTLVAQSTPNKDTTTTTTTQNGATVQVKTIGAVKDTTAPKTGAAANTSDQAKTDQQPASDTTSQDDKDKDKAEIYKHKLDPRWFLGVKGQFQDFAFLEENRKGYLSNASTLPFFQRGNTSIALSAYKNLTSRLSFSADLGLSFGHVTSDNVLISQTQKMTFNLLNAALYYHLLSPVYRLQPYVTVGFNDIINNGSYPCVPIGIGAKFNSPKVMVLAQVAYGQSVSSSIASTTMYSVGIYIPIKSKKYKNLDTLDNTPYNRRKDDAKKKDSTGKGGTVINNIYVTVNMDSILKAKGLLDDNGNAVSGRRGGRGDGSDDDDADDAAARRSRRKKAFSGLGLDDFSDDDYKIDSLDGKPVIRFVVYFEFNEYGLNSHAFGSIDKVIYHLKKASDFTVVEIKGYTDSVGSDPYNNYLSRRRAKMVLDYMNSRGVPTEIMKAKAYGRDNPVADNSDPNKAWLNRRAEIIIHKKEDLATQ
jgi:outer membrane protein OmpA-like peptidoglycan-associated protein